MPNPPSPEWPSISGVPAVVLQAVVVVVSGPVAITITPVPVEEVEARAARDAAKPTDREGGWVEEEEGGGGGRGTGVVGVPAERNGMPSLLELMMERRRPRPPKEVLSAPPKEPLSPSREAWDSLYPGDGRLPLLRRFDSPPFRLGRLSPPDPPALPGVHIPPATPSIPPQ